MDLDPLTGDALAALVRGVAETPADMVAKVKTAMTMKQ
jgi:hypothetical protein